MKGFCKLGNPMAGECQMLPAGEFQDAARSAMTDVRISFAGVECG